MEKDRIKRNQKRKEINIRTRDLVFVKTPRNKKQDLLWDGPFEVLYIDLINNGIEIQRFNARV